MTAWDDAARAAAGAGVEIRALAADDLEAAPGVWRRIWDDPVMERHLLTALEHAGNYVAGAFVDGEAVGAAAGFFGPPADRTLHSHVAGVVPEAAGKGVGLALKLHQRAWCLDQGIASITWTYDPLIARNAHFNLVRLGARIDEYLVEHYGQMTDGINAGDESDRALARWDLAQPWPPTPAAPGEAFAALVDDDGMPAFAEHPAEASALWAAVPADIESLRRAEPDAALAWRRALRDTLASRVSDGWRIAHFARDAGYLLEATA